jgi:hypothetical protein
MLFVGMNKFNYKLISKACSEEEEEKDLEQTSSRELHNKKKLFNKLNNGLLNLKDLTLIEFIPLQTYVSI